MAAKKGYQVHARKRVLKKGGKPVIIFRTWNGEEYVTEGKPEKEYFESVMKDLRFFEVLEKFLAPRNLKSPTARKMAKLLAEALHSKKRKDWGTAIKAIVREAYEEETDAKIRTALGVGTSEIDDSRLHGLDSEWWPPGGLKRVPLGARQNSAHPTIRRRK